MGKNRTLNSKIKIFTVSIVVISIKSFGNYYLDYVVGIITMTIVMILEQIANNAHDKNSFIELIKSQPQEIQEAFLTNNADKLKKQFANSDKLADRVMVFNL